MRWSSIFLPSAQIIAGRENRCAAFFPNKSLAHRKVSKGPRIDSSFIFKVSRLKAWKTWIVFTVGEPGKRAGNTSKAAVVGSLKGEVPLIGNLNIRKAEVYFRKLVTALPYTESQCAT